MVGRADASPWRAALVVVILAVVMAGVSLVAVQVVPPVLTNLSRSVADGSPVALRSEGSVATVTPPEGWIVSRLPWAGDAVAIASPDGVLQVAVSVTGSAPEDALDALVAADADAKAGLSPTRVETLASGATLRHVDTDAGTVLAVVGDGGTVSVVARTRAGVDAAAYRPSIARMLEGIGVGP